MAGGAETGQMDRDTILTSHVKQADGYAGDISAKDSWALLGADQSALLIDVRTRAEWSFVGLPDLTSIGRELGLIEWVSFPEMSANIGFADQLDAFVSAQGGDKDSVLLFVCRSGQRSIGAAMAATQIGYKTSLNVLCGFEGDRNMSGQRGKTNGWKFDGLPWSQG